MGFGKGFGTLLSGRPVRGDSGVLGGVKTDISVKSKGVLRALLAEKHRKTLKSVVFSEFRVLAGKSLSIGIGLGFGN